MDDASKKSGGAGSKRQPLSDREYKRQLDKLALLAKGESDDE